MRPDGRYSTLATVGIAIAVLLLLKLLSREGKKKQKSGAIRSKEDKETWMEQHGNPVRRILKLLLHSSWKGEGGLPILMVMSCMCFVRIALLKLNGVLYKKLVRSDILASQKNKFWQLFAQLIAVSGLTTIDDQVFKYLGKHLGLTWRRTLTDKIHSKYFKNKTYYNATSSIQDLEDVLSTDTKELPMRLAQIVAETMHSVSSGLFFVRQVYAESGVWSSLAPYTYLVGCFYFSSVIAPVKWSRIQKTLLQKSSLVKKSAQHISEDCESIAAQAGEGYERRIFNDRLSNWIAAERRASSQVILSGLLTQGSFKWLIRTFVGTVVVMPYADTNPQTEEEVEQLRGSVGNHFILMKEVLNSAGNMTKILHQLNLIKGNAARVNHLLLQLDDLGTPPRTNIKDSADRIEFKNVCVRTPGKEQLTLVRNLSFSVEGMGSLLITGHNGAGKSSIFRCLAGLWGIPDDGQITKPSAGMFYLPQKPYSVEGSVAQRMLYPGSLPSNAETDMELVGRIEECLRLTGLQNLFTNTSIFDEISGLSLGEEQRLAIARLLYHKPKFVILDECTSAVSHAMERQLYVLCKENGIGYITISHRPVLQEYHDQFLQIGVGEGGYTLTDLPANTTLKKPTKGIEVNSSPRSLTVPKRHGCGCHGHAHSTSQLSILLKFLKKSWPKNGNFKMLLLIISIVGQGFAQDIHSRIFGDLVGRVFSKSTPGSTKKDALTTLLIRAASAACCGAMFEQVMEYVKRDWETSSKEKLIQEFAKDILVPEKCFKIKNQINDPGQRMTTDAIHFCETLSDFIPHVLQPVVSIMFAVRGLSNFMSRRSALFATGYVLSGFAVVRAALPYTRAAVALERAEDSHFTQLHQGISKHAEAISFMGGEVYEEGLVQRQLGRILESVKSQLNTSLWFGILNGLIVRDGPTVLNWIIRHDFNASLSTPDYKTLAKGHVYSQEAVVVLFNAVGVLMESPIGHLTGHALRLEELQNEIEALKAGRPVTANPNHVKMIDASVRTPVSHASPTARSLVKNITVTVTPKTPLMVTGPNGCGKTGFFRVLAGLWDPGADATVERPADLFLVPQKLFLVSGSLADQITYPRHIARLTNNDKAELQAILGNVGLAYLSSREAWDSVKPWSNILSLGEQQRLGMARLFYNKPSFAVLDECTSAISIEAEEGLYQHARRLGITCITISQRLALNEFHTQELALSYTDSWKLKDIK
eukprot:TRINITY_DN1609_c1_g2_i2.p1 TRINITY_DN1609_c1_g2~~TRINITY_DN1609_c1_g2_i2.p1  ORF type:complete len:1213 (+),score=214.39 TRINITY_DN1609_c1_g2_i2:48-3686(+)